MKRAKSKLAIFDIDGTLTDSVVIHQTAFTKTLEKFGLFDFDTNWNNYKHHTDSFIFKTIFEAQFETDIADKDFEHFEDILIELISLATITSKIVEIKGANDFLNQIANDFDIVFATGSLLKPAKHKLQQAGISIDQSLIITANKIFLRDEIVLKALEQAKHFYSVENYEQIISFGDGLWDYETAKNLNIDFIGIANTKLLKYGVDYFFTDFTDKKLLELLEINIDNQIPNFEIINNGTVSKTFTENNIFNFHQAIDFLKTLPYGRNANKETLTTLFTDGCGTCSTKHALLKQLADENGFKELKLLVGLFKMNEINTPEISTTLKRNNIEYIPEAHCYLRYNDHILDCTRKNSKPSDFIDDLIEEIEISPNQITDYKINFHKNYLMTWLDKTVQLNLTLNDLWTIREQCIQDIADK